MRRKTLTVTLPVLTCSSITPTTPTPSPGFPPVPSRAQVRRRYMQQRSRPTMMRSISWPRAKGGITFLEPCGSTTTRCGAISYVNKALALLRFSLKPPLVLNGCRFLSYLVAFFKGFEPLLQLCFLVFHGKSVYETAVNSHRYRTVARVEG